MSGRKKLFINLFKMYIFMIENVDEFFLFKPPLGRDALVVIRFEANIIIGRESRATHLKPNV